MTVPANAEHPCTAFTFMNYVLDAENGATLTNWNYYGTPNEAAVEFVESRGDRVLRADLRGRRSGDHRGHRGLRDQLHRLLRHGEGLNNSLSGVEISIQRDRDLHAKRSAVAQVWLGTGSCAVGGRRFFHCR